MKCYKTSFCTQQKSPQFGRACCEEYKLIHHHQHHDHHSVVQLNNSETYVYNRRTECDIHDSVSTYSSSKINLTSYA